MSNDVLVYFTKVNIALMILWLVYTFLLKKNTFLRWKRLLFISIILFSCLYPLVDLHLFFFKAKAFEVLSKTYSASLPEVAVSSAQQSSVMWYSYVAYAYIIISLLLFTKFIFQIGQLVFLKISSKATTVNGQEIYLSTKISSPFSFLNWVFIPQNMRNNSDFKVILEHELAHKAQIHSFDVLLSELLCIFFWINPISFLLKREIRNNLEFLADHSILTYGFDGKKYQYLLLNMMTTQDYLSITNNFNVSPLKKRIIMMNSKQSSKLSKANFLLYLPLVFVFLFFNDVDSFARVLREVSPKTPAVVSTKSTKASQPLQQDHKKRKFSKDEVFVVVENPPSFPGGIKALMSFLSDNIKYPKDAKKAGIQGRVICQFVVAKDGSVNNIKVVRGVSKSLDAEAVNALSKMPKWNAGTQRGEKVNVKYMLPVNFIIPPKKKGDTSAKK